MVETLMPSITRRNLLSTAAASITASNVQLAGSMSPPLQEGDHSDPVIPLWEKWFTTHQHCGELCRQQQQLETRLFEIVRDLTDDEGSEAWNAADEASQIQPCMPGRSGNHG